MSIDSTRAPSVAAERRLSVPWLTVLPFAAAMAFADGFWMVALRSAVGSIQRSQEPFTTWLRESTLAVPFYLFAVLGALMLAMRWFGPVLRTTRSVLLTALMIVAAGTIVGVVQLVVSSMYDYQLQSDELTVMGSMHGSCTAGCLNQLQQAQISTLFKAGLIVAGLLLVSNLVLVGWILAMRGGRLAVATGRQRVDDAEMLRSAAPGADQDAVLVMPRPARTRVDDVRLLLVTALLCSAHLHVAVIPEHLTGWGAAALLLLLLAAAEVAVAAMLLQRQRRAVLVVAALVAVVPLVLWLYSRTAGLPFGPGAGSAETFGVPGTVAAILEVVTLLAALLLLRRTDWLARRPSASAHARALLVLAVIAVTFIGIAGTALSWFDQPGSADNPSISHSHTGT